MMDELKSIITSVAHSFLQRSILVTEHQRFQFFLLESTVLSEMKEMEGSCRSRALA